jgi:hypothetical protein
MPEGHPSSRSVVLLSQLDGRRSIRSARSPKIRAAVSILRLHHQMPVLCRRSRSSMLTCKSRRQSVTAAYRSRSGGCWLDCTGAHRSSRVRLTARTAATFEASVRRSTARDRGKLVYYRWHVPLAEDRYQRCRRQDWQWSSTAGMAGTQLEPDGDLEGDGSDPCGRDASTSRLGVIVG